ncbi:MAG: hypothetical protein L0Y57_03290 [Beijerinckiaceae bacterium]|nr:hypothetical protein [Beijerinckiaceae bacterium]
MRPPAITSMENEPGTCDYRKNLACLAEIREQGIPHAGARRGWQKIFLFPCAWSWRGVTFAMLCPSIELAGHNGGHDAARW